MKTRLQTILETVENLMEYYAPDHIYKFDRSKIPVYDYISRQPVQRRPRVPSETDKPPYPRLPPSIRPGAGDFDKVPYTPQRPGSNSGLVGAGSSVSGYDSRPKTGGLLGAGSSVSGYDSGSDAPTPQPPSNKPPYPRLPPSVRPGAGDGFDKVPYNPNRPGFKPYRPEPTPDIGPYKPFPKIPSTPKRPGIGIEPRWPRIRIEQEISDAERRRRSEQLIRAEDRPVGAYPPTKSTGNISRTPYT